MKPSQIAPVFFVRKKNSKKYMVQDYRYLNEWTIKNNYPLLIILDIVENIGTRKVFTKIDLQWGYNNVWIKERDKWKIVFMISERLFEPTVMFFELTNFLVVRIIKEGLYFILFSILGTRVRV